MHGISHFIEILPAITEGRYVIVFVALFLITIEILASFHIPNEHIHIKPRQTIKDKFGDDSIN